MKEKVIAVMNITQPLVGVGSLKNVQSVREDIKHHCSQC